MKCIIVFTESNDEEYLPDNKTVKRELHTCSKENFCFLFSSHSVKKL